MIAPKNPQTFDGCVVLWPKTTKRFQNRDLDQTFLDLHKDWPDLLSAIRQKNSDGMNKKVSSAFAM